MSTRNSTLTVHPTLGGLDISTDPTVLDPNFLVIADNIEYLEGGQRKKRLGTSIYSTSTGNTNPAPLVSTGTPVRAVFDYWHYGASLTPTQTLISVAGASIFTSTGNGAWTAASVSSSFGVATNTKTTITLAGDYAVIGDESAQPVAWTNSLSSSLLPGLTSPSTGSAWPQFTGGKYHLNRLFYYGLSTAPSKVGYTAANNIFDSTGSDTGTFTVNAGDGDQVMAISEPYFASIYFFKGPQKGSIWQLSGNTPATFSLVQVGFGAPILNPNSIITTPTDIFWISQHGVHSLETTVKFGNVEQAFLSLPIQKLWRENLIKRQTLGEAWAFWHPTRNIVGWCVTPSGDSTSRWLLIYNYALSDPRPGGKKYWSIWKYPNFGLRSGATMLTPVEWDNLIGAIRGGGYPTLLFGGDDGTVYVGDCRNLNDAGNAYTATIRTPTITKFKTAMGEIPETREKGFVGVTTYFAPKGNYTAALTAIVDQRRTQSQTLSMLPGGATLT